MDWTIDERTEMVFGMEKIRREVPEICRRTNKHTDRQTRSSQYSASPTEGEVIIYSGGDPGGSGGSKDPALS